MTFEEFDELQKQLYNERVSMAATKGKEYAGNKDRLNNFKQEGEELEISPLKVCHIFFNKHMRAIISFINNGTELSEEKIHGRFQDAILYLELMYALVYESKRDLFAYSTPIRRIYRGGAEIYCKQCKQPILIGEEYNVDPSGYNHYRQCSNQENLMQQQSMAHKLDDIIEQGTWTELLEPRCVLCTEKILFREGFVKYYSENYAHTLCHEKRQERKTAK